MNFITVQNTELNLTQINKDYLIRYKTPEMKKDRLLTAKQFVTLLKNRQSKSRAERAIVNVFDRVFSSMEEKTLVKLRGTGQFTFVNR